VKVFGFLGASGTIPVHAGWNIVGSEINPFPTSSIGVVGTTLSSMFFNYIGYYQIADSIIPGTGYWVKANSDGALILDSTRTLPKRSSVVSAKNALEKYNWISIRDAQGNAQKVYFGTDQHNLGSSGSAQFELPPLPVDGVFDVRFASNRMLEIHPLRIEAPVEYPIVVNSATGPVAVSWHVMANSTLKYTLIVTDKSDSKMTTQSLKGDGSMSLQGQESPALRLRVEEHRIPTSFALRQNYPNPFNPVTLIRYELPSDALVTLTVYDILGKEVTTLVHEQQEAGYYETPFNGESVASGVYFYRLTAGKFISVQKMLITK
jgi:hypothetical protein